MNTTTATGPAVAIAMPDTTAATTAITIEHPQVTAEREARRFPGTWQRWTEPAPEGEREHWVWCAPHAEDPERIDLRPPLILACVADRGLHWTGPKRFDW